MSSHADFFPPLAPSQLVVHPNHYFSSLFLTFQKFMLKGGLRFPSHLTCMTKLTKQGSWASLPMWSWTKNQHVTSLWVPVAVQSSPSPSELAFPTEFVFLFPTPFISQWAQKFILQFFLFSVSLCNLQMFAYHYQAVFLFLPEGKLPPISVTLVCFKAKNLTKYES